MSSPEELPARPQDIAPYATDWRRAVGVAPVAVLRPGSTAEVAEAVRRCVAQGSRSSRPRANGPRGRRVRAAGRAARRGAELERMNRIRTSTRATSSVWRGRLRRAAGAAGPRWRPTASSPSCGARRAAPMVGGMLGTNAGGIRTIRWGKRAGAGAGAGGGAARRPRADDLRRVRKDNSGYALRHLFIGRRGRSASSPPPPCAMVPPMRAVETAFVAVPSPDAALSLLSRAMGAGAEVVAFELIRRSAWRSWRGTARTCGSRCPSRAPVRDGGAGRAPCLVPVRQMMEAMLSERSRPRADRRRAGRERGQRAAFWRIREDYPEFSRMAAPRSAPTRPCPSPPCRIPAPRRGAALAARWPEGEMVGAGPCRGRQHPPRLKAPPGVTREEWVARAGEATWW
jgi:FAD/FMN-containing dehydrogenase